MKHRIESILSARLFLSPQRADGKIYFISNLSGKMSLYAMDEGGSVPQPLIPPHIALQNPALIGGYSFYVLPEMAKILLMLDNDGDEVYQPMLVPLEGGFPEPAFGDAFEEYKVHLVDCFPEHGVVYVQAESRKEPVIETHRIALTDGHMTKMAESPYGFWPDGFNEDHSKIILGEHYQFGDSVLYLWDEASGELSPVYGTPLDQREGEEEVQRAAAGDAHFINDGSALLMGSSELNDDYGLVCLPLDSGGELEEVAVEGLRHTGRGEMTDLEHMKDDLYKLTYNIDGVSWIYEAAFDFDERKMTIASALVGEQDLAGGVVQAIEYDNAGDGYAISFSSARSPAQIYTIDGDDRAELQRHTQEQVLGILPDQFSAGEDASYESFDGLPVSARLYLPVESLGFKGARPLIYYIHGGPQGQERPDFTWFSMPLIQFMTLHGFAVFVPNVRGSTGYGLQYTKYVDRDWGGDDRLDHVHAMQDVLPKDKRLDLSRAAVMGRSYGGYMTLMLAGRHPELWSAAVDMFGPYDLVVWSERIPETWKTYFKLVLGDPQDDEERKDIIERSPKTYLHQLACPMLVIQGANDPRVVEQESRDIVEGLRSQGKQIEYLVFEDEGHDVLKFDNRVLCYNRIKDFCADILAP